jgi:hypothetical protein
MLASGNRRLASEYYEPSVESDEYIFSAIPRNSVAELISETCPLSSVIRLLLKEVA